MSRFTQISIATFLVLVVGGFGAALAPSLSADEPTPGLSANLAAWRAIPVLEDGRIMPLDTFARRHTEAICHVQEPKLAIAPGQSPVKWRADELLLDWLARPSAWEDVPFLIAEHEELRALLGLELFAETPKGKVRLKFAAPSDVADSEPLRKRLVELDERRTRAVRDGQQFRAEGVDAKVEQLWQAYVTWRQLVFRAADESVGRTRFVRTFQQLVTTWKPLRDKLPADKAMAIDTAFQDLAEATGSSTRFPTTEVLPRIETLRGAIDGLAIGADSPADLRRAARRLGDRLTALGESLYDNGGSLHVVPALHADALEAERSAEDDMPAWLAWPTLLDAPPALLPGYPPDRLEAVRSAFSALAAAVAAPASDRARPLDVQAAADNLASRLRSLGDAVEPLRATLPIERQDADLLRHTAYPPPGSTTREVTYNVGDPFRMSWVAALLALAAYAVSFGRTKVPLFWLATALLIFQLGWTAQAFASRVAITGWAPVTNMYETVIYVPFFLTFLGLSFLLAPILATGLRDAWRMTALPAPVGTILPGEATPLDSRQRSLLGGEGGWSLANWVFLIPRLALSALVLWILAMAPYAAGALAWGLGILSLGHYLLGSYTTGTAGRTRPPEACNELAGYIYKAMQVAVILLAAGTILGGLWADVSWGRFWGWDPKEVWALVSLLAYLVVLHGRYAGWIGNFGLAAGAVLGAAVIGMSWYGVNFLLGAGLHSYGFGKGGQTEFFIFLIANFLLLAAAGFRMKTETAAASPEQKAA